jgi:hypothetical protein
MSKPVMIELAGKSRQLRYDFTQIRKIKKQYNFSTFEELCKLTMEDYLPSVLMDGCMEKDGLTIEEIEKSLTGPDTDQAFMQFCTAFFPPRVAQLLTVVERNKDRLIEKLNDAGTAKQEPETIPPILPTVM